MLTLVEQIKDAVKDAMRARDKARLAALRLITAEFKRIEVDERIEVDDARALAVLDKMVKQRLDSEAQYRAAGRDELAEVEAFEIRVIREYLPAPLSDDELDALIKQTVVTLGGFGNFQGFFFAQGRLGKGSILVDIGQHLTFKVTVEAHFRAISGQS